MGVDVSFMLGPPDGPEKLFWGADLRAFSDWAWRREEDDPDDYGIERLARLDRIVTEGPGSFAPADAHDAEIIDAITDLFFAPPYQEHAREIVLKPATQSVMYRVHYENITDRVVSKCSPHTSQCWQYLLEGRPVGRSAIPYPYTPSDCVYRFGYWTTEDVAIVHKDLSKVFPGAAHRVGWRARGESILMMDEELAIEVVLDATTTARSKAVGLILCVS